VTIKMTITPQAFRNATLQNIISYY